MSEVGLGLSNSKTCSSCLNLLVNVYDFTDSLLGVEKVDDED